MAFRLAASMLSKRVVRAAPRMAVAARAAVATATNSRRVGLTLASASMVSAGSVRLMSTAAPESVKTTASGLQFVERVTGTGPKPKRGNIVSVHYTGTLENGTVFDSSVKRGEPIEFPVGEGMVIAGWDEALLDMTVGSKRKLIIPAQLGYGPRAVGPIPANSTLIFEVELLSAQSNTAALDALEGKDVKSAPSGLKYVDSQVGTGDAPAKGQKVTVHYTGRLVNGKEFDSSVRRGEPFKFNIGAGQVIKGWDEGVGSMKVGGKRTLIVPPHLGYGGRPVGPIPANSTLVFDVELLATGK